MKRSGAFQAFMSDNRKWYSAHYGLYDSTAPVQVNEKCLKLTCLSMKIMPLRSHERLTPSHSLSRDRWTTSFFKLFLCTVRHSLVHDLKVIRELWISPECLQSLILWKIAVSIGVEAELQAISSRTTVHSSTSDPGTKPPLPFVPFTRSSLPLAQPYWAWADPSSEAVLLFWVAADAHDCWTQQYFAAYF